MWINHPNPNIVVRFFYENDFFTHLSRKNATHKLTNYNLGPDSEWYVAYERVRQCRAMIYDLVQETGLVTVKIS